MFRDPPWAADYATKKIFFIIILKFSLYCRYVSAQCMLNGGTGLTYSLTTGGSTSISLLLGSNTSQVIYITKKKLLQYYKYVEYERNVNKPSL